MCGGGGQDSAGLSPNLLSTGTAGPSCTHCSTVTTRPPCTTSLSIISPTRWACNRAGQAWGQWGRGGGGPEGPLAHTLAAPCPLQLQLMSAMRASIVEKRFPDFVRDFMGTMYGDPTLCPTWATEALASVGITLS